jgi:outer membrane receptor protein involved in Fe transport
MTTLSGIRIGLVGSVSLAALLASPGMAQTAPAKTAAAATAAPGGIEEIVVTAQRTSQSLQDVPIAVTAFTSETLTRQQIRNTSDLQLSLPNVTFTKGNFTGSNFTIRGVGDTAVATSGDTGLGIHVNEIPLTATLLFETDYFDLERVEVLRGPQGTLFGRNATSGVLDFITARPNLTKVAAGGSFEYGNYNSYRGQGFVNIPISDKIGLRFAGTFLKRDGYTNNLFTGNKIDGRDQYAVRGTLRLKPSDDTTIDIIAYHFSENSNRSRIQKQLCHRDPTGILGCLPDRLEFETLNNNATLGATLSSRQFFSVAAAAGGPAFASLIGGLGLNDVYGPDSFINAINPRDLRTVNLDYEPTYRAAETQLQIKAEHDFGSIKAYFSGGYASTRTRSRTDYNLAVQGNFPTGPGSGVFNLRNFPVGPGLPSFANAAARLFQGNNLCVSAIDLTYTGYINSKCDRYTPNVSEYDESGGQNRQWSAELHLDSQFDGPFNFLVGGIYLDNKVTNGDYYVASSGLDYGTAVIGALQTGGTGASASPFFNSRTDVYTLQSFGIFGEAYLQASDTLKFTAGLRYSQDRKRVEDYTVLFNSPIPYGTPDAFGNAAFLAAFDADAGVPGNQRVRVARLTNKALTGRFVVDWKPETSFSESTLVYFSYSRGYKPGGINPPFNPLLFTAPSAYLPETINALEIGTKNTFLNGTLRANLSAFYYDYKNLQISRIINRTSFNDNTNAQIYGVEAEFILAPTPRLLFNISGSYLKTKVKNLSLVDTRDPAAGLNDTVIIKDLQGGANCIVRVPGNPTLANGIVNTFNAALGLRPATPVPETGTTGAFSLCGLLASTAANPAATPLGQFVAGTLNLSAAVPLPIVVDPGAARTLPAGNPVNLDGNSLPNAPNYKFAIGGQYTVDFNDSLNAVFRVDYTFTGNAFSRSFNRNIDRVPNYDQVNMQVQLNGGNGRWFVRGFVQNLTNNNAITGQYVTDPSSGLFTNIFTLEPRRYGVAIGGNF